VSERGYLSIGEVLSLLKPEFSDLTISKIRFLESQGLLDPERTPSGYRKFYEPDIERLRWILRQQQENYLPLKVIKGKLVDDTTDETDDAPTNGTAAEFEPVVAGHTPASVLTAPFEAMAAAPPDIVPPPERDTVRTAEIRATGRSSSTGVAFQESSATVSLTLDELSVASGLSPKELGELERFGLVSGKTIGGTTYYDGDVLTVAHLAAGFMRYGVEARHLRMYRTSAEREASFFEQVVMPMLKQRNPQARKQAVDTLRELSKLGAGLRAAMLRQALRDYTSP
jgi:DNA-binding transcriptional MerR regulator